jgi:predicted nucleic acid-binding protein
MRKILVDADIILEYLLNREDFRVEAEKLWEMIESQKFKAFITESGLAKICFYVSQLGTPDYVQEFINNLKKLIKTCPIDEDIIYKARASNLSNFEAAIEIVCATQMELDGIVAWKPEEFDANVFRVKVFSIYKLFALELVEVYDQKEKFLSLEDLTMLSQFANEGAKRINVVNIITGRASFIVATSVRQMILNNEALVQPGGNCYTHRRMAACLRDTEIILRYLTYSLFTGNENILQDRCLNGLKETYLALGVPIDSSIYSVNMMRENIIDLINQPINNSQLEIKTTDGDYSSTIEELKRYFDMIVSSIA